MYNLTITVMSKTKAKKQMNDRKGNKTKREREKPSHFITMKAHSKAYLRKPFRPLVLPLQKVSGNSRFKKDYRKT